MVNNNHEQQSNMDESFHFAIIRPNSLTCRPTCIGLQSVINHILQTVPSNNVTAPEMLELVT